MLWGCPFSRTNFGNEAKSIICKQWLSEPWPSSSHWVLPEFPRPSDWHPKKDRTETVSNPCLSPMVFANCDNIYCFLLIHSTSKSVYVIATFIESAVKKKKKLPHQEGCLLEGDTNKSANLLKGTLKTKYKYP